MTKISMMHIKLPFYLFFSFILCAFSSIFLHAQETSDKLSSFKMRGYVQTWLMGGEAHAKSTVGKHTYDGKPFVRMGVRRLQLVTSFTYHEWEFLNEMKLSEQYKIELYRILVSYTPSHLRGISFYAGIASVPFGYGCPVSSSLHETIERANFCNILFPGNTDMGVFFKYIRPKNDSYFNYLSLDMGLLGGNGTREMMKSYPDCVVRALVGKKEGDMERIYGLSTYLGYAVAKGQKAKRWYIGCFNNYNLPTEYGTFRIRGEIVGGWQAGSQRQISATEKYSSLVLEEENLKLLERPFFTASALVGYRLSGIPLQLVAKYDYFNRNLRAKEIASKGGTLNFPTDGVTHQTTLGINYYQLNDRIRWLLNYECNLQQEGYAPSSHKPIWLADDDRIILSLQFIF